MHIGDIAYGNKVAQGHNTPKISLRGYFNIYAWGLASGREVTGIETRGD